jgi:hypothetical protein
LSRYSLYLLCRTPAQEDAAAIRARLEVFQFKERILLTLTEAVVEPKDILNNQNLKLFLLEEILI